MQPSKVVQYLQLAFSLSNELLYLAGRDGPARLLHQFFHLWSCEMRPLGFLLYQTSGQLLSCFVSEKARPIIDFTFSYSAESGSGNWFELLFNRPLHTC